jgi:hypothetical protein
MNTTLAEILQVDDVCCIECKRKSDAYCVAALYQAGILGKYSEGTPKERNMLLVGSYPQKKSVKNRCVLILQKIPVRYRWASGLIVSSQTCGMPWLRVRMTKKCVVLQPLLPVDLYCFLKYE